MTRHNALALVTLIVALCAATATTTVHANAVEPNVTRVCHFTNDDAYMCAVFRTNGTWLRDEVADSGNWSVTAQAAPREDVNVNRVCRFTYSDTYLCAVFQTDGTWLRDEMMDNGNWIVTAQAVPVNAVRLP